MANPVPHKDPPSLPTAPAGDGQKLGYPARDVVTALRVVGTGIELPLPADKHVFTLGSRVGPQVDFRVTSTMAAGCPGVELVSRTHALLQRRGNCLTVRDLGSTNGTFVDDRREDAFERKAGEAFRVGDITLLAMDERMRSLHEEVRRALGLTDHERVDQAVQTIVRGEPLLMIGARACEQRRLAESIHAASERRASGFLAASPLLDRGDQVRALVAASHGTMFVDLAAIEHVSSFFATHLFGTTYKVRPIIAAQSVEVAMKAFGPDSAAVLRRIDVPRLQDRRADVPALLDDLLGGGRTVAELGPDNVARLAAFDWPDNFDDLRRNAPRIRAYLESGGVRAAARSLSVSHTALLHALRRIGIMPRRS